GTAVPSKARRAIAGDRCDDAAPRIDPADAVVEGVAEEQIAGAVERDIERPVQQGRPGRSAIAGKALVAGPDRRRDHIFRHRPPLACLGKIKASTRRTPRTRKGRDGGECLRAFTYPLCPSRWGFVFAALARDGAVGLKYREAS